MIKLILFDFDGTLSSFSSKSEEIIKRLSEKYGFNHVTYNEFLEMRDLRLREAMKKLKIPFWKLPFMVADFRKWMGEYVEHKELTHLSWKNVIKELKIKIGKLGILTSNSTENVELFLKIHDIGEFDFVNSASLFGKHRSLIKILRRLKMNPQEILYIGDEIRDIEACKRAGIPVLSVTWGMNSREALLQANPDYCIDNPEDIFSSLGLIMGDAYAAC